MTAKQAYDTLVLKYNGKSVTVTGPDKGQCTAIAHALEVETGNPIVYGHAIDTYNNAGAEYNKGTSYPAPLGAVAVYGKPYGLLNGVYYGHTGASRGDGVLFQQNDPTGTVASEKPFGKNGYIGYFIPKNLKGDDMFEGRTAEDWANQAKDAERYKQGVVKSLSWKKIPGQIGGGMDENPDNIRPVIDSLEKFKADNLAGSEYVPVEEQLYKKEK